MLPGASMYYVARRSLHAACCPSYPAPCIVHRAWCTRAVKYLPASSRGLPLPLHRRRVGLVRRRAACLALQAAPTWCSRAVAGASGGCSSWSPPSRPRRGRRRDSLDERGGIQQPARHRCWGGRGLPSRSIPQPHHSGPVPRSGTVPRSVTSSHGGTASRSSSVSRSDMVSLGMGPIVVATSEAEHPTSNEAAQHGQRTKQGTCHASPRIPMFCFRLQRPDEHRDDDLVSGCACGGALRGCRGSGAPFGLDGLGKTWLGRIREYAAAMRFPLWLGHPVVAGVSESVAWSRRRQEDESWRRAMQRATIEPITALGSARRGVRMNVAPRRRRV